MNIEQAIKDQAAALVKRDTAASTLTAAQTKRTEAENAYAAQPTDENFAAVEAAERVERRAELDYRAAEKTADAATATVAALEEERRETERAEAAERASLPAVLADIAPALAALAEHHRAQEEHLRAIAARLERQHADAAKAGMPMVPELVLRAHVLAAFATSGVPAELGVWTNRQRTPEEELATIALLLDAKHVLDAADLAGVRSTPLADVPRLLSGELEAEVRRVHRERAKRDADARQRFADQQAAASKAARAAEA